MEKAKVKRNTFFSLVSLVVVILLSKLWNIYILIRDVDVPVNHDILTNSAAIKNFILGEGSELQYFALKKAVSILIFGNGNRLGMITSYLIWILLVVSIILWVTWLKQIKLIYRIVYCILCMFGFVIWWLGTMYVILFRFTNAEMKSLSSYDRYLQTYIIGIVACLLCIVFQYEKTYNLLAKMIFASVLMIFMIKTVVYNFKYCIESKESTVESLKVVSEKCGDVFRSSINPEIERVYIIDQTEKGLNSAEFYLTKYYLAPIKSNFDVAFNIPGDFRVSFCLGNKYSTDDISTTSFTIDEFSEVLEEYSYILIMSYDQNFEECYGEMFEADIEEGFYKIDRCDNQVKFIKE